MRGGLGRLPHGFVRRETYGMATVVANTAGSTGSLWGSISPPAQPKLLDRKYPNALIDWCWQWLFPQENR